MWSLEWLRTPADFIQSRPWPLDEVVLGPGYDLRIVNTPQELIQSLHYHHDQAAFIVGRATAPPVPTLITSTFSALTSPSLYGETTRSPRYII